MTSIPASRPIRGILGHRPGPERPMHPRTDPHVGRLPHLMPGRALVAITTASTPPGIDARSVDGVAPSTRSR